MKKFVWITAIGLLVSPLVFAEMQKTPVAPAPAPAMAVNSMEGTISSVDVKSATPWVKVKDAMGMEKTIMIDPVMSTAWKAGKKAEWSVLTVGAKANVRTIKNGDKETLKSIELM